jgi:hypothetical protein
MVGLISVFFLGACVSFDRRFSIDYEVVDDIKNESIMLYYTNTTEDVLCLSLGQWPNLKGVVDRSPDTVSLHVADQVFRIDYPETGYCAGCTTEAVPGQTVVGRLPYTKFQLPKELYTAPKELAMEVMVTRCK